MFLQDFPITWTHPAAFAFLHHSRSTSPNLSYRPFRCQVHILPSSGNVIWLFTGTNLLYLACSYFFFPPKEFMELNLKLDQAISSSEWKGLTLCADSHCYQRNHWKINFLHRTLKNRGSHCQMTWNTVMTAARSVFCSFLNYDLTCSPDTLQF